MDIADEPLNGMATDDASLAAVPSSDTSHMITSSGSNSAKTIPKQNLLDLPGEMVDLIISHLVRATTINKAWRLRSVCRIFRNRIEEEILTYTPLEDFKGAAEGSNDAIIHENIKKVVTKRCFSNWKNLENNALPMILVRMVDQFLGEFPPSGNSKDREQHRVQCLLDLIRVVFSKGPVNIEAILFNNDGLRWDRCIEFEFTFEGLNGHLEKHKFEDWMMVIVAAASGNMTAVNHYLQKDELVACLQTHWSRPHRPLCQAISNQKFDVVNLILHRFEHLLKGKPTWYDPHRKCPHDNDQQRDKVYMQLKRAIWTAVEEEQLGTLGQLFTMEFKYYDYCADRMSRYFKKIIDTGCMSLVRVACEFKKKTDKRDSESYTNWWKAACTSSHVEMVEYLLDQGIATVGSQKHYNKEEWPLQWVGWRGQATIARVLIKHGADLNSGDAEGDRRTETPLNAAISTGNLEVAKVLLDAGAKADLGNPMWSAVYIMNPLQHDSVRLLLEYGSPLTREVTWSIETNARLMVISGTKWIHGEVDLQALMAMITIAAIAKDLFPRSNFPLIDWELRSRKAPFACESASGWPTFYYVCRVLRRDKILRLIPQTHSHLVKQAADVVSWLLAPNEEKWNSSHFASYHKYLLAADAKRRNWSD